MQQIILVLAIGSLTFINASVLPIKFNFGNNKPVSFAVKQCGKGRVQKKKKKVIFITLGSGPPPPKK